MHYCAYYAKHKPRGRKARGALGCLVIAAGEVNTKRISEECHKKSDINISYIAAPGAAHPIKITHLDVIKAGILFVSALTPIISPYPSALQLPFFIL